MTDQPAPISPDDAANAALAYAIWDSENSIRMKADRINEHIERAQSVRHWLKVHGFEVVATDDINRLRQELADAKALLQEASDHIGSMPVFRFHPAAIALVTRIEAALSPPPPASPPASSDAPDR